MKPSLKRLLSLMLVLTLLCTVLPSFALPVRADEKSLRKNHSPDCFRIIISFIDRGLCALEQSVVALRIEQTRLVKPRLLKAVVNIRGQDKVVLTLQQLQQGSLWQEMV